MKNIFTQMKVDFMVKQHEIWLQTDGKRGTQADFSNMDLRLIDLSYKDLRKAIFKKTYLGEADLSRSRFNMCDFTEADLSGAFIRESVFDEANCECAKFTNANIKHTHFHNAYLKSASLERVDAVLAMFTGADLAYAKLNESNFSMAIFFHANLTGVYAHNTNFNNARFSNAIMDDIHYNENTAFLPMRCPEVGSYIGFKRCGAFIVELLIPEDAARSSATSNKCRASKAKVLAITNIENPEIVLDEICSDFDIYVIYRVGETVEVTNFNNDRWVECSTGIHHFLTREEAVNHNRPFLER